MPSRKLDEVSTDIDDVSLEVEELQDDPAIDADKKLKQLHKTLEDAADIVDDIENTEE